MPSLNPAGALVTNATDYLDPNVEEERKMAAAKTERRKGLMQNSIYRMMSWMFLDLI
jgi:hypothetical protein